MVSRGGDIPFISEVSPPRREIEVLNEKSWIKGFKNAINGDESINLVTYQRRWIRRSSIRRLMKRKVRSRDSSGIYISNIFLKLH